MSKLFIIAILSIVVAKDLAAQSFEELATIALAL